MVLGSSYEVVGNRSTERAVKIHCPSGLVLRKDNGKDAAQMGLELGLRGNRIG